MKQTANQLDKSFPEQTILIKKITEVIDYYSNFYRTELVNNAAIRGISGCRKS